MARGVGEEVVEPVCGPGVEGQPPGRRRFVVCWEVSRVPVWLWPNLLSLDAPVVALVWQDFIARTYGIPLRLPARLVLGLTVWAIYLGDRLLDVRGPATGAEAARHRFSREHGRIAMSLLVCALAGDIAVTVAALRPAVLQAGLFALVAVAGYLIVVPWSGVRRIPKELAVAALFTAGTFVTAWAGAEQRTGVLAVPAASFLALCFANLVAIEVEERRELGRGRREGIHGMTAWAGRAYPVWVGGLVAACALRMGEPWYGAVGASGAALLGIWAAGGRLGMDARRVLVDVAMLTPLLFL